MQIKKHITQNYYTYSQSSTFLKPLMISCSVMCWSFIWSQQDLHHSHITHIQKKLLFIFLMTIQTFNAPNIGLSSIKVTFMAMVELISKFGTYQEIMVNYRHQFCILHRDALLKPYSVMMWHVIGKESCLVLVIRALIQLVSIC